MSRDSFSIFSPTAEHEMLRQLVRKFSEEELEPGARLRDHNEYFDRKIFSRLGDLGLLGITAPDEYGGAGMDAVAAVLVHEEISAVDPGIALAYLAHSMLVVNNLAQNADDDQKLRYLPRLCSGEWIGAMAMSEPEVGTDVLSMKCRAQKNTDGYIINGRKLWITNGSKNEANDPADVLFLYAKTNNDQEISSFVIEGGQNGYRVGQCLKGKLGMRASNTAEIVLEDCQIASTQRIGDEGQSKKHMMRNLELERLTLAAMSLGIARRSLAIMNRYAGERKAFEQPLFKFGQIQKYIAESYAKYKACRSFVYHVAGATNLAGADGRLDSDAAKLIATSAAKEIADAAIQVLGGNGYMAEFVVERLWRDAKLLEIGGGTLEAHQKNMAFDLQKYPQAIMR